MAKDILIVAYGQNNGDDRVHNIVESFLKYGQDLGKIVVAGNPPATGIADNVVFLPVPPMIARGSIYDNSIDCVNRVIEAGILTMPFLYVPPEVVLTQETNLEEYPCYIARERIRSIADYIRENKGGAVITRHKLVLADTRTALERAHYPIYEFTGRFLTHIDPTDAPEAKRIWLEEPHGEFGYDVSCLFGNIRFRRTPFDPVRTP